MSEEWIYSAYVPFDKKKEKKNKTILKYNNINLIYFLFIYINKYEFMYKSSLSRVGSEIKMKIYVILV